MAPSFVGLAPLLLVATAPLVPAQAGPASRLRELQPRIDAAIDRGVAWLLEQQLRDGSWSFHHAMFPTGMTGLAAYTLQKAGLSPTHPSVRRALLFLAERRPEETYSAACVLLAFATTRDAAWYDEMKRVLDDLLSWQQADGFSYPREWGNGVWGPARPFRADVSNMQYAALGMRAAQQTGLKVPTEAWSRLAQQTLAHQEEPVAIQVAREKGRTASPKQEIAGFHYALQSGEGGRVTGSMTAAGVAILTMCKEALAGKISRELDLQMTRGIELGLGWLTANLSIPENPKQPGGWLYYWLYGLERVCSLRGLDTMAGRPWYLEGATFLVDRQQKDGDWPSGNAEADTCFAILFLERATAPATGAKSVKASARSVASSRVGEDLHIEGQPGVEGGPAAFWVTGLSAAATRTHAGSEATPVPGVRVLEVEYLVDGEVVGKVKGEPGRALRPGETFTFGWKPPRRGRYAVTARMRIVAPEAAHGATEPLVVLESKGFTIDARFVHEPWMDEAARGGVRNVMLPALRRGGITATSSSRIDDARAPSAAVDGQEASAWICKPDDPEPWIRVELDKGVRADQLVLTQLGGRGSSRGEHDRAMRIRITIQGQPKPLEVDLPEDATAPATVPLPAAIAVRRFEITVLAREPGSRWKGECGFHEITLELSARAKR